jgi:hypothetical protein
LRKLLRQNNFLSGPAGGSWTPNKHGAANAWFLREENKKISGCASAPYFFFPPKRLMLYPVVKIRVILIILKWRIYVFVEVDSNSNTDQSFNMIFRDISPARELYCIKYPVNGEEQPVQVTGWDAESNTPCPAYACKVEESGDGVALLIYGGSGGVRMKLLEDEIKWDPESSKQWGDTHLVYPADCFTVYKDEL